MTKRFFIPRSQYIYLILYTCLVCMTLHVVVDSTSDLGLAQIRSHDITGFHLHEHVHEDDFLAPGQAWDVNPGLAVARSDAPYWKADSLADAPLLPPPKII